ncbi:hypothetical protein [Citricoccus nitrophenolicus]|uniref:hypothetical protein n=1 Tax=Citricoccus nitrophenolicus TaxID=863575 RepID=UPI0031E6CC2C
MTTLIDLMIRTAQEDPESICPSTSELMATTDFKREYARAAAAISLLDLARGDDGDGQTVVTVISKRCQFEGEALSEANMDETRYLRATLPSVMLTALATGAAINMATSGQMMDRLDLEGYGPANQISLFGDEEDDQEVHEAIANELLSRQ